MNNSNNKNRITARFVWAEFLSFLCWEKGALYTTARILVQPGLTIRAYLNGDRKKLTNPIRFLLMACAIVTAAFVFGMPRDDYVESVATTLKVTGRESVSSETAIQVERARTLLSEIESTTDDRFLKRNAEQALEVLDKSLVVHVTDISLAWMNVFLLLALPANAIISWLCFRRAKLNLTEHVVANAYILAIQNLASLLVVLLALLNWVDFNLGTIIYMLMSFIYQFVAWRQTFAIKGLLASAVGFAAVLTSVFVYLVLQGIAMFAVLYFNT